MKRSTQHELFISGNPRPAIPIRASHKPTSSSQRFAVAFSMSRLLLHHLVQSTTTTQSPHVTVQTSFCSTVVTISSQLTLPDVSASQCSRSPQEGAGLQPRETADPRLRILCSQRFIRHIVEAIELLGEHSDSHQLVDVFWETS